MAEKLTGVNGNIIKWAREYYHMSIPEAAAAIGVDSARYEHWEKGLEYPTYAKLRVISRVLHKPSAIFFFPEPPDITSPTGDLRTLSHKVVDRFGRDTVLQFEKAKIYQLNISDLYDARYCILSERDSFPKNIRDLCIFFRKKMSFPLDAQKGRKSTKVVFEIFREKFYELGIYVFKDSFGDDSVSGLSLYDEKYPVIVINNAMSFARQIFTLFHELYHLIKNTSGAAIIRDDYYEYLNASQRTVEKECDEFANAFLIPDDDFRMELSKTRVNEDRIKELAILYSVSREAIMYQLLKNDVITSDDYSRLKEEFYGEALRKKNKGTKDHRGGGNYYATQLTYLGKNYTGEVLRQYYSGKIDASKAGSMLGSKIDHLSKLELAYYRGMKA